jgi:hypothetical protein
MTLKALKDFQTDIQVFKAGDELPADIDLVKWEHFVVPAVEPAPIPVSPAEPAPLKF